MSSDDRTWQPWLRVQRLLRNEEAWPRVKEEIPNALKERRQIERAGWFD